MGLYWDDEAWNDYISWQSEDKKTLKKINSLIKDLQRNGTNSRLGKAEILKNNMGYSKRIDESNRLVYRFDKDGNVIIASCKGHYEN